LNHFLQKQSEKEERKIKKTLRFPLHHGDQIGNGNERKHKKDEPNPTLFRSTDKDKHRQYQKKKNTKNKRAF
jgi:hypothetical protein